MKRAALTALGVLIGLAVSAGPTQAGPAPGPGKAGPGKAGPSKAAATVTLITGDQVTVEQGRARLRPGPHRTGITYFQTTEAGHSYVYPSDAWPLIAAKRLDRRLFDVTGLLAQGYGDAKKPELPLIVQYRGTKTATYRSQRVPKKEATTFWRSARAQADIQTIWLDGKAQLSLDVSVPHIGAPTAWQAGIKGAGVKVAVLDTGYDPTHPDLKDAVVESRNFTNDPAGIVDTIGHGTHVASILAGRGTASGGRYTGVAPEANLLVGKVCANTEQSDGGPCPESAILAGLQWAAERGARVVNLSLGGGPTDGTDPIASAVNTLTAQYGTLFVASSGNHYPWEPAERSVASPAAADAALAVGSFDNTDQLSDFSNQGPRIGDFAIKPDLGAPGDGIAAARAAQGYLGDPVDDHYTRLSGTSMASPHAAGAAALLAQQHPDWKAGELKAALMSTAKDAGFSVYAQGAGRVDVARAVGQPVWASPGSLSLGYFRWPNSGTPPASKTVTYHNDGANPVTLTLTQNAGEPFTLGASTVTVPAHGTANVTLTATPSAGPAKLYGGSLVASDPSGTQVRTAIGAYVEPESYNLTVRTLDRTGARPEQYQPGIFVTNLDTGQQEQPATTHGEVTLRLPKGRYAIWSGILTGPTDRVQPSTTLGIVPEVQLDGDVTLSLDARQGRSMVPHVDRPDARSNGTENLGIVQTVAGQPTTASAFTFAGADLFAIPTAGRVAGFGFYEASTLLQPQIALTTDRFAVPTDYVDVSYVPHFTGDEVLEVVDGGKGTAEDLAKVAVRGRLVLLTLDRPGEIDALAERVANVTRAGGKAVQLTTYHRPKLDGPLPIPTLVTSDPAGQRLLAAARAGALRARLRGQETSPYQYNLMQQETGRIPESMRVRDRDLAEVHTVYGAQGVDHALATLSTSAPLPGWSGNSPVWIGLPAQRTELFSTGTVPGSNEPLYWFHGLSHEPTSDNSQLWGGSQSARRGPFRAGSRSAELWNVGPFGPCTDTVSWFSDDVLGVELPPFCDSQATHTGGAAAYGPEWSDAGSTVITRDGVELGRSNEPGWAIVEGATKAAGAYTVHVEATRSAPWTALTPRIRADWAFNWTDPDTRPSLLAVRYSTPLDQHNRGPGRLLGVWVEHGSAPVSAVRVEVSYDDGAHWSTAPLRRGGPGWMAALDPPRDAKFVSLRATASDAAGNRVTQEVTRAFALR